VNGDGQTATVSGTPTDVATAQSTISLSQGGVTLATHAATFSDIENLDTAGGIGDYPTGMVADSTDRKMFVAATSSNAVDAIDAASNPVAAGGVTTAPFTAAALSQPDGLGYAGGTLFASNFASANLAQLAVGAGGTTGIDSTDHPTTGCFHAEGVAPDSSDSDVFVACFGSELHDGSLSVLSPTGALLHSFAENDASPAGVAPDGTAGDAVVDEVVARAPALPAHLQRVGERRLCRAPAELRLGRRGLRAGRQRHRAGIRVCRRGHALRGLHPGNPQPGQLRCGPRVRSVAFALSPGHLPGVELHVGRVLGGDLQRHLRHAVRAARLLPRLSAAHGGLAATRRRCRAASRRSAREARGGRLRASR
jgi:hypothetical protein